MGGIGKTTLAEKLFNSLLPDFKDAACFLESVRTEASHADGMKKLQQDLLMALTGSHISLSDVTSGLNPFHLVSWVTLLSGCMLQPLSYKGCVLNEMHGFGTSQKHHAVMTVWCCSFFCRPRQADASFEAAQGVGRHRRH